MPNFNSTLATAAASALTDGSVTTKSQDVASPVLYAAGEIVIPAGLANTDTFTLVAASQLPVGAKVDPLLSFFYAETNPGTTLAFDVGTPADPDKYADNLALGGSSGVKQFGASGTLPVAISAEAVETSQAAIIATVAGAPNGLTTGAVIQFRIAYRVIGG